MGNSSKATVIGTGILVLHRSSGKSLTLTDVLRAPDVCKNLISGSILGKNGFKLVFESIKFEITKNEIFVGKGYVSECLFKLNVTRIMLPIARKARPSD